jgi:hypothetical protein
MQAWYDIITMRYSPPTLDIVKSPSASVAQLEDGTWHLEIPSAGRFGYRLAELDDHGSRRRQDFLWKPPISLSLQARVSSQSLPGTWGFGWWNDPFSFMMAYNKVVPRLPTLPQAAWFFHASAQNYLSFVDDQPATGFLAATFSSSKVPLPLLVLASPILSLTLHPKTAQLVRRLFRKVIRQAANLINTIETDWHSYNLQWETGQVSFLLDGVLLLETEIAPQSPLSLVMWVDNQYAALPPSGRLRFGTLSNPEPAWLEIKDIVVSELMPT